MTRADAAAGTRALELASGSRHVTRSREAAAGGCLNTRLNSAGGSFLFGALRQPPVLVVR